MGSHFKDRLCGPDSRLLGMFDTGLFTTAVKQRLAGARKQQ